MSASLLLWMMLAVSVFWGVGLYNRLMRMRARGLGALGSVEKHMRVYADLVREHVTLRGPGSRKWPRGPSSKQCGGRLGVVSCPHCMCSNRR